MKKIFLFSLLCSTVFLLGCFSNQAVDSDVTEDLSTDRALLAFDAESEECTNRVERSNALKGQYTAWPLAEQYYPTHTESELARIFAAAACDMLEDEFPEGTNQSGIYVTFDEAPSGDLLTTLTDIGFVPYEAKVKTDKVKFTLNTKVPVTEIAKLRSFSHDDWFSTWGGLK